MEGISNKTIVNFFENETDDNKIYFLSWDDWKKSLSIYNNEYGSKQ